jgi:aminoglycoside/choline kinase family phosphotransferase
VHRWLVEEVHILHRDVSFENLMFRMMNDGQKIGVLHDFDLAVKLKDGKPEEYVHLA